MDVSRLVPEAQPIAAAAGEVYLRHTQPWFVGLVAHARAVRLSARLLPLSKVGADTRLFCRPRTAHTLMSPHYRPEDSRSEGNECSCWRPSSNRSTSAAELYA